MLNYIIVMMGIIYVFIPHTKFKSLFKFNKQNNRYEWNKYPNQIYGYFNDNRSIFEKQNLLKANVLIIKMCIVVFMSLWFIEIILPDSYEYILGYFAWHTDISKIITRPWTTVVSGFTHVDVTHIALNLLFFYQFDDIMRMSLGNKTIWNLHIFGTIGGTLLVLLIYNVFPCSHGLGLGASCGIFAIMSAFAYKIPNYSINILAFFIIPMNLTMRNLLYFGIGLSILMVIFDINTGGGIAHIGGALVGWSWVKYMEKYDSNIITRKLFGIF